MKTPILWAVAAFALAPLAAPAANGSISGTMLRDYARRTDVQLPVAKAACEPGKRDSRLVCNTAPVNPRERVKKT